MAYPNSSKIKACLLFEFLTIFLGLIRLNRLKGEEFWLNHRMIETVEVRPDTVIVLSNEHKYVVQQKPEEIRKIIQAFEREIFPSILGTPTEN